MFLFPPPFDGRVACVRDYPGRSLRAALAFIVSRFIDWVANRIFAFSAAQLFIRVGVRRPLSFVDVKSWVGNDLAVIIALHLAAMLRAFAHGRATASLTAAVAREARGVLEHLGVGLLRKEFELNRVVRIEHGQRRDVFGFFDVNVGRNPCFPSLTIVALFLFVPDWCGTWIGNRWTRSVAFPRFYRIKCLAFLAVLVLEICEPI
jgi:hypothetical protein